MLTKFAILFCCVPVFGVASFLIASCFKCTRREMYITSRDYLDKEADIYAEEQSKRKLV